MKKFKRIFAAALSLVLVCTAFVGAQKSDWRSSYDLSLPDLGSGEWKETMNTDFTQIKNMDELKEAKWAPSPHAKRRDEYWCDEMLEFTENGLIVHSERQTGHECEVCKEKDGIFTSGIETKGRDGMLFEQAYGYYEATVILPRGEGMWSAFWLQCDGTGKVGHKGEDGAEIDVYESSFLRNPTQTGQAVHYDAYDYPWYHSEGNVTDTGKNLYDGEPHTYALKWTPDEYVIYVDSEPVWASDYGNASKVPEYLRLTVEIRENGWGPYGQEIGTFKNHDDGTNDFVIKSVRVYQNENYEQFIKSHDDYKNQKQLYRGLMIAGIVVASLAASVALIFLIRFIYKKVKKNKA